MKVEVSVRDVMSTKVLQVLPGDNVLEVVIKMREKNIGSAIVVSPEGTVSGMVTERDLAFKMLPEKRDPEFVRASEIMTSPVVTVEAGEDLVGAAELMRRHNFRRLPVVEEGKLVGIITQTDVADVGPELIRLFRLLLGAKDSGASDQISQYYQEKKAKETLQEIKKKRT